MADTIDLLEAIGRDASLRHASADELTKMLDDSPEADLLVAAVASGDITSLSAEFGTRYMVTTQATQHPSHEEDEEYEEDRPDQDDDAPGGVPAPDREKSSLAH